MQVLSTKGSSISYRTILNIAYSIMLGNLAQTLIAVTDTAFLGQLGEVELGAASMSGIYYYFFTTLAWGFSIGVQILVARRLGENAPEKIVSTLLHGLVFIVAFASILFGVIHLLTPHFLGAALTSQRVYDVSIQYLDYRGYGIFFSSCNFMFRSFYIGLSSTKSISYSTILMALVNIFLDWALIFGTSFNPAMGVKGAALASVTAEVSATIFFVLYTIYSHPIKGYSVFHKFAFHLSSVREILSLSWSTMMQKMISYGIWLYFFFVIEAMGERELAVTMVLRNIFMMISIPAFAFAATSNTLTSRLLGQNRDDEVIPTIHRIIRLSLIITLPLLVLLIIAPGFWIGISTNSMQIIDYAIPIAPLLCLTNITFCIGLVFFEGVSGTGYTQYGFWMEFLTLIVYVAVIWYCTSVAHTSLFWVWTSDTFYGIVIGLLSYLFIHHFNWRKRNI